MADFYKAKVVIAFSLLVGLPGICFDLLDIGSIIGSNNEVECDTPFLSKKKEEFLLMLESDFDGILDSPCYDLSHEKTLDITNSCEPTPNSNGIKVTCHVRAISQRSKALFDDVLVSVLFHNEFVVNSDKSWPLPGTGSEILGYCLSLRKTTIESQSPQDSFTEHLPYYVILLGDFTFEPLRDIQKFRLIIELEKRAPFGILFLNNTCYEENGFLSKNCIHSIRITNKLYISNPEERMLSRGKEFLKNLTTGPEFRSHLPLFMKCNFPKLLNDIASDTIHYLLHKWITTFNSSIIELFLTLDEKVNTFPTLTSLQEYTVKSLIFDDNHWQALTRGKLPYQAGLESLSIVNSAMLFTQSGALSPLQTLKHLNFSNNQLQHIPSDLEDLSQLESLDLSYNPIIFKYSSISLKNLVKLKLLKISGTTLDAFDNNTIGRFPFARTIHTLEAKGCSVTSIESGSFTNLSSLAMLDLSDNFIKSISANIFLDECRFDKIDFSNNQIQEFLNPLKSILIIEEVDLSSNDISDFENVMVLFQNASYINLSNNKIAHWSSRSLFRGSQWNCSNETCSAQDSIPKYYLQPVKSVNLSNNRINILTDAMVDDFRAVDLIDVGGNLFDCDNCILVDYKDYLVHGTPLGITNFNTTDPILCSTPRDKIDVPIQDVIVDPNQCFTNYLLLAGVPILVIFLTAVLMSSFGYYYRWQLKYIFYLMRLRFEQRKDQDLQNKICKFDAFVCYSTKDESWVIEELLDKMENNFNYRFCIHQRDFLPGKMIKDNIVEAVNNSRFTILVLSENLISSEWCMWELNMAEHQIFSHGIVVVQLTKVDKTLLSDNLKVLIESRTYIEWPVDSKGHKLFWRKLQETLGSPNSPEIKIDKVDC